MPALRFRVKICLNLALKFSLVLRQTECCSRKSFFKTLITLEPKVLHRSDDKNDLKRLGYPTFIRLSKIRLNSPNPDPKIGPQVYLGPIKIGISDKHIGFQVILSITLHQIIAHNQRWKWMFWSWHICHTIQTSEVGLIYCHITSMPSARSFIFQMA